jgi:hypothetical protein
LRLVDQLIEESKDRAPPHVQLQLSELRIVVACKLWLYKSVAEEMARLGNLNDERYSFETHKSFYPTLRGSFVPFSLRIIQAEVHSFQGNSSLTIDGLFSLLNMCDKAIQSSPEVQESLLPPPLSMSQVDDLFRGPISLSFQEEAGSLIKTRFSTQSFIHSLTH